MIALRLRLRALPLPLASRERPPSLRSGSRLQLPSCPVATAVYTVQLIARATPDEAERVRSAARGAGLSVSRYLVRQATGTGPAPLAAEARDELAALRRALARVGSNLNQLARAANSGAYDAAEVEAAAREVRGLGRRVLNRLD